MDRLKSSQANVWLWVLLLLAVAVRVTFLSRNSLWFDEAYSANEATKQISVILAGTDSRHPPLYYAFLHYWTQIFGSNEWSLRLPSALASVVNLGLLYKISKKLFGQNVARTAVFLLAFSPLDIWYAQEARMYMLVTFIGLLYALSLLWHSRWRVAPLTLVLIAGIYIDYTAVPLLIAITAIWFVYWWRENRENNLLATWGMAFVLAMLAYVPWWPKFNILLKNLSSIHIFANFRDLLHLPYITAEQFLLALLFLSVGLILTFHIFVHLLQKMWIRRWLSWTVVAGLIISLPIMVMPRLYTIKRVLVTGWPFVILFAAWLVSTMKGKAERIKWGLTAVSLIASFVMVTAVVKDDWRGVAAHLAQVVEPNRVVWVDPTWNEIALRYYAPDSVIQKGDIDALTQLDNSDVWLVAERLPSQIPPSSASETWLNEHMEFVQSVAFTRLELRQYRSR